MQDWLSLPPEELFQMPGLHRGLSYLQAPDWFVRAAPGARPWQITCIEDPLLAADTQQLIDAGGPADARRVTLEISSSPVVAEDVRVRGANASCHRRYLTNGAAGDRILNKYSYANPSPQSERRLQGVFRASVAAGTGLPQWDGPDARRLDLLIECRNLHNYYHFMTESLCHLAQVEACGLDPANIIFQAAAGEARSFPVKFVAALFPELAGRVSFAQRQVRRDSCLMIYDHRHHLYQSGEAQLRAELAPFAADPGWGNISGKLPRRRFASQNSFDSSLRLLRERALSMLPDGLTDRLPRRVILARDTVAGARARPFEGAERLYQALESRGFERVYFEHLSPLDQVAQMQAAEVVIGDHGAGFANMMFSRPDAHVIEVGTAQTKRYRWGDFLPNANVSGCTYSTVFCDMAEAEPGRIPRIGDGHLGIRLGADSVDVLVALAEGTPPAEIIAARIPRGSAEDDLASVSD